MPAAARAVTAVIDDWASLPMFPPPAPQVGSPSVASKTNRGVGRVRPIKYFPALASAVAVGVNPPGVVMAIAPLMGAALLAAIGTATPSVTPQALSLGKNLSP